MLRSFVFLAGLAMALPSAAAFNIFACEPEWAALAKALGGDKVSAYSATHALQDPHRIEARPSLIARARSADLLVCTGAELEIGWLPVILGESGNRAIQAGQPGQFFAADFVALREKPAVLDRAAGDVHAAGNPHIQTDPRNIARVGAALAERMAALDAADAGVYRKRWADFSTRWNAAIARWEKAAAPLKGTPVVVQHKAFPYLLNWLGLKEVAVLEPKPGVEPSLASLAAVKQRLAAEPAKLVIRAAYQPARPSEWIAAQAGVKAVVVPFTVGGDAQSGDLFGLFDSTVSKLLAGLK